VALASQPGHGILQQQHRGVDDIRPREVVVSAKRRAKGLQVSVQETFLQLSGQVGLPLALVDGSQERS